MLQELLSQLGVPALICAAAAIAWYRLTKVEKDVSLLWDRTSQHETRLSRAEGRWEAKR